MKASFLIDFIEYLRTRLAHVRASDVEVFFRSLACLEASGRRDVYWAGRLAFCRCEYDVHVYGACFARFFDSDEATTKQDAGQSGKEQGGGRSESSTAGQRDMERRESRLIARAAEFERLHQADFATLDAAQREPLYALIGAMRARPPMRRSRRHRDAGKGMLHAGRTTRSSFRWLGEVGDLRYVAPRHKVRRCVLLLDISGSMQDYAQALILYGYSLVASMPGTAEVFAIGTRLTRLTACLKGVSPDTARANVAEAIRDWHGGTRLGGSLKQFLSNWGQRGLVRGSVVIIASDGWESGEAQILAEQMMRLGRLAYRTIWINPHKSSLGYEPTAAGMRAALPHVDEFVGGATLEELSRVNEAIRRVGTGSPGAVRAA